MSAEPVVIENIEESELAGENGEVYLFQWLSSTEKKLRIIPIVDLKAKQGELERTFIKIISASEGYPLPGRALRNLVGRSLVALYTRGETRTLFDTLQALLRLVGDAKILDKVIKIAAFSCIGDLMAVFGSQVMSFMAEICTVTLKAHKLSSPVLYTPLPCINRLAKVSHNSKAGGNRYGLQRYTETNESSTYR